MTSLDTYILGANPLSGVDHFLPERARERALLLNKDRIISVIIRSLQSGAQGFNFGANPTTYGLLRTLRDSGFDEPFGLYPIVPDLQIYVSSQLKKGTFGMISDALDSLNWSAKASALFRGGLSVVTLDPLRAMKVFLDVEINKIIEASPPSAKLKSVIVHEAVTDLAMLLEVDEVFKTFVNFVKDRYDVMPGFVTRNLPRFIDFCQRIDLELEDVVIMTPINKLGFQMTPTKEACEKALLEKDGAQVIAMSILAAGQIGLSEAIKYLNSLSNIRSVVVGVSRESHAQETFTRLQSELRIKEVF